MGPLQSQIRCILYNLYPRVLAELSITWCLLNTRAFLLIPHIRVIARIRYLFVKEGIAFYIFRTC